MGFRGGGKVRDIKEENTLIEHAGKLETTNVGGSSKYKNSAESVRKGFDN